MLSMTLLPSLEGALDAKQHLITALRSSIQANPDMRTEGCFRPWPRDCLFMSEAFVRSGLLRDNVVTQVYPASNATQVVGRSLLTSGPTTGTGVCPCELRKLEWCR